MSVKLEGTVDHIIYRLEESGYTVLNLVDQKGGNMTVVGVMPLFEPGESVVFTGDYTNHPVYDLQFKMTSCELKKPEDRESVFRYLSSGVIRGVGKGLAKRIVDRFGDDSFRIMEEEPERLAEVRGISLRKAMEISEAFEEKVSTRRAFTFLQKYGISNNLIQKICSRYKEGLFDVIKTNPYRLIDDIEGVGFKTADSIARHSDVIVDETLRIGYGILYVLSESEGEGNTCLPKEELVERSAGLLESQREGVADILNNLSVERKVILKEKEGTEYVYSPFAYRAECECAEKLKELGGDFSSSEEEREKEIRELEKTMDIKLEDLQREAVIKAVSQGVFIMTGGPGTGKTTTINVIINYFSVRGYDITLTAPTGRAAKRMTEATGYEAYTIHRLLGARPGSEGRFGGFEHDGDTPLETDVIIVDEMSMVDIFLFRSLLKAVVYGTRLILVGDENQLPSVGPGAVLKDMISSGCFPVVTLTKIYRQSEAGDIVMNAHNIRLGKPVKLDNASKDFFFLERENTERIIRGIFYLIRSKLPPYVKCSSSEIQVMSPMRKGPLGVENLNLRLQEELNPPSPGKYEVQGANGMIRLGDKVMQIKNDYDIEWEIEGKNGIVIESGKGVFNGDSGVVVNASSGAVIVRFEDGRKATYSGELLSKIELAYAITIHKSQGSEYPAVIIPLLSGPELLMNRNLLYTGVTRAKSCVVIIGKKETVYRMIDNTSEQKRYTGLGDRIREKYEELR